jgi:hypothetical protein
VEERAVLRRDRTLTAASTVHLTSVSEENATFSWHWASGGGFAETPVDARGCRVPLTARRLRVTLRETQKGWPMNSRTLLGLAAVLIVPSISAHAQAVAEAALANAHSSTVTIKAGSALGHALNQGSSQLAGRIQQIAPRPTQTRSQAHGQVSTQANVSIPGNTPPTGSSLIVSVRGGEAPACGPANQRLSQGEVAASTNPNCGNTAPDKTKPQAQYKSAVKVAFPTQ